MAIDINKDISYQLSINVLKALGGNTDVPFESVEEVWDEINKIYDNAGDRLDIEALIMDIRNNGLYEFYPNENADAYAPVRVNVNVPQKYTDEYVEQLGREAFNEGKIEGEEIGYQKGFEEGSDDGYQDGYSEGLDDGAEEQKSLMVEATIRENGVFERSDGYRKVTVDVTIPTFETEQLSVELTENGDYNYTPSKDGYDSVSVSVNVPTSEPTDLRILDIEVKENKSYEYTPTDYDGWNKVNLLVNVPTGGGGDSGKPKIYNEFQFTGGDIAKVDFSQYDWSNVYDTSYFFQNCSHSTGDWSNFLNNYNGKILTGYYMFHSYMSTTIPQLDTSNVKDMSNMFCRCSALTSIPQLDTSNVTNMSYMFESCNKLTSIPQLDTSNVTNMSSMFYGCRQLTSLPKLYCGKISSGSNINIFSSSSLDTLTDLGGFEDLGKESSFNKPSFFLKYCYNLTKESVINVINNLYDRNAAGYSVVVLPFHIISLNLLSDEEKAIATNKGWTLATS